MVTAIISRVMTRRTKFEETIQDNYKRKGTLVIPTFSLERAQELLFEMDQLVEHDRVPTMPIFFDSPLAIKLTKIYSKYTRYFNDFARKQIGDGDNIFNFPGIEIHVTDRRIKRNHS